MKSFSDEFKKKFSKGKVKIVQKGIHELTSEFSNSKKKRKDFKEKRIKKYKDYFNYDDEDEDYEWILKNS